MLDKFKMAKSIIMYGAGFEAKRRLKQWESEGLIPSCFADSDSGKHHLFMQGEKEFYEILPLHEAINRYPDYLMFITLLNESQESCRDYLLGLGIPADRIRLADNVVYRKGCRFIDYNIHGSDAFKPCCNPRWTQTVAYSDNLHGDFKKFLSIREHELRSLDSGEACVCGDCPDSYYDWWEKNPKLKDISVGGFLVGETCNSKCIYCAHTNFENHAQYSLMDILTVAGNLLPNGMSFRYSSEELTISPYRQELHDFCKKRQWSISELITNAFCYDEVIVELLKIEASIITSIDAGTPETFKKVKGVDCLEQVIENLRRYKSNGFIVKPKYIFLEGINDNEKDINGFMNMAAQFHNIVIVTFDMNTFKTGVGESVWRGFESFLRTAYSRGYEVCMGSENMNNETFNRAKHIFDSIYGRNL